MTYIAHGGRAFAALERIASANNFIINNGHEPVFGDDEQVIPAGCRVKTIDQCGTIADDWQWADQIYWPDIFAWRQLEHDPQFQQCDGCEELVAAKDLDRNSLCHRCDHVGQSDYDLDEEQAYDRGYADGIRSNNRTIAKLKKQVTELEARIADAGLGAGADAP